MSESHLSSDDARAVREAVASAILDSPTGLRARLEADQDAALALVDAARAASEESGRLLRESIDRARSAGYSWSAIGELLGVSKQAAQQRFGGASVASAQSGARRVLSPVTAFDEMDALSELGRHGWHSVDYGALHHVLEKTEQQWEHRRVLWGTVPRAELESEGWRMIRHNAFPWGYWARPLDVAAEPEL